MANGLALHPGKTKYILFYPKTLNLSLPNLYLLVKNIDRIWSGGQEKYFKYVGIHLDEILTFSYHKDHVHKK